MTKRAKPLTRVQKQLLDRIQQGKQPLATATPYDLGNLERAGLIFLNGQGKWCPLTQESENG